MLDGKRPFAKDEVVYLSPKWIFGAQASSDNHYELPSYEDQINARNNMLEKNRELTFIGAHLASLEWSLDEISAFLDNFPNASVDLAERNSHLQVQSQKEKTKARDFFIKYQDRILYGTDFQELEDTDPSELKKYMNDVWILE